VRTVWHKESVPILPLEGKVAVLTGGTSGIGACTAEVSVANGAKVVIAGRRQDRGEKHARKLGDAASFILTDVSVETDVKAMIDYAVDRFGRVDCLKATDRQVQCGCQPLPRIGSRNDLQTSCGSCACCFEMLINFRMLVLRFSWREVKDHT
jgi:short chain dehydrogenase